MTARPDFSVIVCTYDTRRLNLLHAAVRSLGAQTLPPLEVIVVVDHNPNLLERLEAAEDLPGIYPVGNSGPRGLSGARNCGIAAARGHVIAFLDDDAQADAGWLKVFAEVYEDPRVLGAGGAIEPVWDRRRPGWFAPEFDWVVGCSYTGMPGVQTRVRNLIGANMSFRRDAFELVGTFRSGVGRVGTVPFGCEETELCLRLAKAAPGRALVYEPRAVVRHHVPGTRANWRYFRSRCWAEGISKASVSRLAGTARGLSSESRYTLRTLPRGVARGLLEAVGGDASGAARAATIVAGWTITVAGYVAGRARRAEADRRALPSPRQRFDRKPSEES